MAHRAEGLNDIFEHNITVRESINAKSGTIQNTPAVNKDIANKEYVDDAIAAGIIETDPIAMAYLNQEVKTTSNPRFNTLGLGVAASSDATLNVESISSGTNYYGMRITAGGNATNLYGMNFTASSINSQNVYGGVFAAQGGLTSNIGISIPAPPPGTNNWAIHSSSGAKHWFSGNIGIGSGKTTPSTALDVNGTVTATSFSGGNVTSGQNPGHTHTLDNLDGASASKTFNMANKSLAFSFTNPSNAPTYDGAFEIEATGAFTGDLVHIHQHTGNPGATHLVHLEAADTDVIPLFITSASSQSIVADKDISALSFTIGANTISSFANLDSLADLSYSSASFVKMTAANTFTLDTNTYLTNVSTAYPIGSVFISVVSTNPGTLLGFGTWSAIAAGRMLVGIDAGDTDFDTVEETGGAKTKTIAQANLPNISTGAGTAHTHTQNAHNHDFFARSADTGTLQTFTTGATDPTSSVGAVNQEHVQPATAVNQNESAHTHSLGGSGTALNVVNPYLVVYMWKRTA